MKKELRVFFAKLEAQGCIVKKSHGNHYKVYYGGRFIGSTGSTPSDFRALRNFRTQLLHQLPNLEI